MDDDPAGQPTASAHPIDPTAWSIPTGHDPLGILEASRRVLAAARHVAVNGRAIERFVSEAPDGLESLAWDDAAHWRGDDDRTVAWVFVLDALNFCFWAPGPEPAPRWRVRTDSGRHDGYWALVAALRRAMDEGVPLTDPAWLAVVTDAEVAHLLRPDEAPDATAIPLLPERGANLRELGRGWLVWAATHPDGERHRARGMVDAAGGSAAALVRTVVATFPSFDDIATLDGRSVPFHKRAQILVSDLAGTFGDRGPGAFHDLDGLTAFADYKVPQVLRRLGILRYGADLAGRIAQYEPIPAGSRMEIEIRAGTVWGCELVRQRLARAGQPRLATEVDWLLWDAGQRLPASAEPYHRTPTIFY